MDYSKNSVKLIFSKKILKKTLRTESTNDFSSFHFLVTRGVQRNFFIL